MILLDTHALIWLAADQKMLSKRARSSIQLHAGQLFVSSISAFEMGLLEKNGSLYLPKNGLEFYQDALSSHGIDEIPIDGKISYLATSLPSIHRNPADRLIIASALLHKLTIVTKDRVIPTYPDVNTIW